MTAQSEAVARIFIAQKVKRTWSIKLRDVSVLFTQEEEDAIVTSRKRGGGGSVSTPIEVDMP